MKRKLLFVLLCIFILTGCNSDKELKCVYKDGNSNMDVITTQKYSFDKEGKIIKKINIITEYNYKDKYINYLKNNKIDIKDSINTDSICNSYKSYTDSKCNVTYKNNKVNIEITIKLSKKESKKINEDYKFYKKYYEGLKYECK